MRGTATGAGTGIELTTPPSGAPLSGWLRLANFDYQAPAGDRELALLELIGRLEDELGVPRDATLMIQHGRVVSSFGAERTEGTSLDPDPSDRLWRVSFAVPLSVVEYPDSLFLLRSMERLAIALPRPDLRLAPVCPLEGATEPTVTFAGTRRHLAALSAGVMVALACGGVSAGALAGTTAAPGTTDSTATTPSTPTATTLTDTTATTTPTAGTTTTPTDAASSSAPAANPASSAPAGTAPPTASTPTPTPTTSTTTTTTTPPAPSVTTTTQQPTTPATSHAPGGAAKSHRPAKRHTSKPAHGRKHGAHHKRSRHTGAQAKRHKHKHHAKPKAAKPVVVPAIAAAPNPGSPTAQDLSFGASPFSDQQLSRLAKMFASSDQPPSFLIPIYKAAGHRYHVPWKILAAINAVETNYGRDLAISPAGAMGWMQFMPETWLEWGVSASRRAAPNPYDPRDAIFSAARYLEASGAQTNLRRAIFAYNHALWYVDEVVWRAQLISSKHRRHKLRAGYSLPLDARYMRHLGRTDDGVDIEDAPNGAAVYSITSGVVTAVASDPGGFGPNYPVILATRGPLAGEYIYYGHVAAAVVKVGQHVIAGQPIAIMGHTGDAVSLGHGHIEIGFSDGSGDPLNHHGALAITPSGAAMRQVLTDISAAFKIRNR